MSNGNGFVTAVLASSDVRVQKQPFGSSRVGALGQGRGPRRRSHARRRPWAGSGNGFFPDGGLGELRGYVSGPGAMDPAAWLLGSQMQPDRFGWAFAPAGNPITSSNAYGPALAHGGQGPGRGFGPEYLVGRFDSTWADPPSNVFQQDVGMRAADSSRKLRQALIRRGVREVRPVRRGRAIGVEFDATQPGQFPMAQALADDLAYGSNGVIDAALSSVVLRSRDGKRGTILFTDMPDSLHDEVRENVVGSLGESTSSGIAPLAIGSALGALTGAWLGWTELGLPRSARRIRTQQAAIGAVVGSVCGVLFGNAWRISAR